MLDAEIVFPTPESLIVAMVQQRDGESWNRFARLYAPLVYHWSRNAGLQDEDAADVGQEVFKVVSYKIKSFDPNRKSNAAFRSWLWGITRIKILDHFRSLKRQPVGHGGDEADNRMQRLLAAEVEPDETNNLSSRQILLSNAIKLLEAEFDPRTWKAFWKLAVNGQPAHDIGEELQMSAKAVRQAKYRVIRKLRTILADEFPDIAILSQPASCS